MNKSVPMKKMSYLAALSLAIEEEMRVDESVFVLGQGVSTGGWFGAEKSLASQFGTDRVLDSGICEAFEAGIAAGAAIVGMKPIVNMGFGDFALIAGDEIYHKLAKWRYMHGDCFPMTAVLMLPIGIMGGAGPEHSSSTEVLGMHFPGLKVVVPATAADAKGLMKAALREPNPVLFHNVQALGFTQGDVPDDPEFIVPIGKADIVKPGTDVTIITYGSCRGKSVEAAERLSTQGIDVEVIDLRSLVPMDLETILKSVRKTHKAVIVHEAVKSAGPGAEITAKIQEHAFFDLDLPVLRVAGKDIPLPQSELEALCIPSVDEIATEISQWLAS